MWLLAVSTAFVGVGASAVLVVKAPLRIRDLPVLLMTGALFGFTLVSLGAGGLLGAYRPVPLTVGTAVFAALCWGLALRVGRPAVTARLRSNLRLVGSGVHIAVRRSPRHPVTALVLLVTAAVYGLRAWLSLRLPAVDWDGLMYHLVGPDKWIQAGRLVHTPENIWADTYPMGVELLAAWPGVYLHTTQYAALAQLPCYLLGGFSVLSLSRELGARRSHAVLAGCAFLLTPAVFAEANSLYVDAGSASLALAALSLAAGLGESALASRPRPQVLLRIAATGLATGLAMGSKSSNLVVLPLVVIVLLSQLPRMQARGGLPDGLPGSAAAAFGVPALAVGSWWYLRTWIAYGNPFYPVSLLGFPGRGTVEQLVIGLNVPLGLRGAGKLSQIWASWVDGLQAQHVGFDIRLGGLGPAWPLLILPGAVAGLVLWLRSARRRGPGRILALAAVVVLAASPASWWGRYVLVAVGSLLPLAAYALTRLSRARAGGWAPGVLALGVRASVAGLLVLSAWWGQSAFPITTQQNLSERNPDDQSFTSLQRVVQLADQPDAGSKVWPWYGYSALAEVPDGSTIALLRSHVQPFVHPLIGERLQRHTVVVGNPATTDDLAQQMRKAGARYALLDRQGPGRELALAVYQDSTRFRLVNPPEARINGADLYELGRFPAACRTAGSSLPSKAVQLPDGQVELTGRLVDGCGAPVPGEQVGAYMTGPDGNAGSGGWLAGATTGPDGDYRVVLRPPGDGSRRLFGRFLGRGRLLPAAASNILSAAQPGEA